MYKTLNHLGSIQFILNFISQMDYWDSIMMQEWPSVEKMPGYFHKNY